MLFSASSSVSRLPMLSGPANLVHGRSALMRATVVRPWRLETAPSRVAAARIVPRHRLGIDESGPLMDRGDRRASRSTSAVRRGVDILPDRALKFPGATPPRLLLVTTLLPPGRRKTLLPTARPPTLPRPLLLTQERPPMAQTVHPLRLARPLQLPLQLQLQRR